MKLKHLGYLLIGLFLILLGAVAVIAVQWFNQPMGPTMALSVSANGPAAAVLAKATPTALQPAAPTALPSATSEQKFCGNTGQMMIAVVGSDSNPNVPPPGSDLVRYVQVDFDSQKVTIYTFPRGLWLDSPDLKDLKIAQTTLGKSYDYRYRAEEAKANQDGADKETRAVVKAGQTVAQTVLDNFGVRPDHYVVIKLTQLPKLVDAVGGVTVDNPSYFETNYGEKFIFAEGPVELDGVKMASYVRFADATHSDWERIARQNLVLNALTKKLEDPATLSMIPNFFKELADSFVTDLSAENITDLTCVLKSVKDENTIKEQVHSEDVKPGPEPLSFLPDVEKIIAQLKGLGFVKE